MSDQNYILRHWQCLIMAAVVLLAACAPSIPDGKIQGDIAQKLTAAGINNVTVLVQKGDVTLSGQVPDESLRNQSVSVATSIEGVKSVQSSVIVVGPAPMPTPEIAFVPESSEDSVESLFDEAFDEATKFVEEHSAECGEVYYLRSNDNLWACKYPFEVELDGKEFSPKELSEAEKLNEIDPLPVQWQGSFKINMRLCRSMSLGPASYKTWSEWRDADWHKPKTIRKVKDKWTIDNASSYVQGGKIVNLNSSQCRAGSTIDIPDAFK